MEGLRFYCPSVTAPLQATKAKAASDGPFFIMQGMSRVKTSRAGSHGSSVACSVTGPATLSVIHPRSPYRLLNSSLAFNGSRAVVYGVWCRDDGGRFPYRSSSPRLSNVSKFSLSYHGNLSCCFVFFHFHHIQGWLCSFLESHSKSFFETPPNV